MKSKGDQKETKVLWKQDFSIKKKKPYNRKQVKLSKEYIDKQKKDFIKNIKNPAPKPPKKLQSEYPENEDIYERDVIVDPKDKKKWKEIRVKTKMPYITAYSSILPNDYKRLKYTPDELWAKFRQRVIRAESHWELPIISWFQNFAQVSTDYLTEKKKSQDFSEVCDAIYQYFEMWAEEKAFKWENISYWLNNRFKGKWESNQKVETTQNINPEIKDILDQIIYWKSTDGTTQQ